MQTTKSYRHYLALLTLSALTFGCQQEPKQEEDAIANTHPKLQEQLERKDVKMPVTGEGNSDLYQRYRITMEQFHTSGDYDVQYMYSGRLAPLDEKSHPDARAHRTAIKKAMEEGVNFAGRYTIVSIGCGAACLTHYVVDRQSGKVLDKLQGHTGASYRANSRLFVLDAPDSTANFSTCPDCQPRAYEFKDDKFKKLPASPSQP